MRRRQSGQSAQALRDQRHNLRFIGWYLKLRFVIPVIELDTKIWMLAQVQRRWRLETVTYGKWATELLLSVKLCWATTKPLIQESGIGWDHLQEKNLTITKCMEF